MVTIKSVGLELIHNEGQHFEKLMVSAIGKTMRKIAASLNDTAALITVDDLAMITSLWTGQVDSNLLDKIGKAFIDSAYTTRNDLQSHLNQIKNKGTTAAAVKATNSAYQIPKISNHHAQNLMETARNRMVNVGNDVWEVARNSLVDGLKAGEGVDKLRDRIVASTNIAAPRAGVVARTEISHAMNQGTLQQMKAINVPTMMKEWIATNDDRTRPEHAEVNGEKIGISDAFSIGEEPGDAVNCRCTLGFDIPDDDFDNAFPADDSK